MNVDSCARTCGNGKVDSCYTVTSMGCVVMEEQCDAPFDCKQYGYYGGSGGCDETCSSRWFENCDPCAPNTIACRPVNEPAAMRDLYANGSSVALVTHYSVHLFTGIVEDNSLSLVGGVAVAAVPNGFLVAREPTGSIVARPVVSLIQNGALVPGGTKSLPDSVESPVMASAGNRVLVAWATQTSVDMAILDEAGNMLTTFVLFGGVTARPSVVSDGTSFFVGAAGNLAHVSPDGTATIVTGFPTKENEVATVRWSGSSGWYVSHAIDDHVLTAQRFDGNGAALGNAIMVDVGGVIQDVSASGTDLQVLRLVQPRLSLVRVSSTGAQTAAVEVGAGANGRVLFIGANAFVAWNRDGAGQVALVAPP